MQAKTFGFVRSTQIFFTTMGMFISNQGKLLKWVFYGVLVCSLFFAYLVYNNNPQMWNIFGQYYWIKFLLSLAPKSSTDQLVLVWGQQRYATDYATFMHAAWTTNIISAAWRQIIIWGVVDLVIILIFFGLFSWYFTVKGHALKDTKFLRGMRLVSPAELIQEMRVKKVIGSFFINTLDEQGKLIRIPFTRQFERGHLVAHGTTGSGKGMFLMDLLEQLENAGDKAIIYDKGCTFTKHFFNAERGDIILNPFDARCANWDMWLDAPSPHLLDNMAAALIPQHAGMADPFWVNAARVIFASVAGIMREVPEESRSIEKLLEILIIKKLDQFASYLVNTDAASLSDDRTEKMAISIRSILVTYCRSLRYLIPVNAMQGSKDKFSIREWLQDKNRKGWLFITCRDDEKDVLKPLISLWLDTAVSVLMSMPEDYDSRTWFIYDEIASLQKLPSLSTGLAEIRKFGGCMVLGMQSFAQLQSIYGKDEAQAIFSLLNTRLFFRSPDGNTAKFVAIELGEQEVEEARESYSYGTSNLRDGISLGVQKNRKQIVEYSEIQILNNLQFYLRLMGNLPVTLVQIVENLKRPVRAEPFCLLKTNKKTAVESALEEVEKNVGSKLDVAAIKAIIEGKEVAAPISIKKKSKTNKSTKKVQQKIIEDLPEEETLMDFADDDLKHF